MKILMRLALGAIALFGVVGMSPSTASAAPAQAASQYVSYRAAFSPNQALEVGIFGPTAMTKYSTFGTHDWRKELTINGFRLHNRYLADQGLDYCLTGSGTAVFVEPCAPASSSLTQNWRLVSSGGGVFRLQSSATAKYVTYPSNASGAVSLASLGAATTQAFLERN